MKHTTLCYIEQAGCYLLLHRIKKKNDVNQGKWIGIGGKLEAGETPEDCVLREAKEETGLTLTSYRYCAVITFLYNDCEAEAMHLFHADQFAGTLAETCSEGALAWIAKEDYARLPQWQGDRIFLRLMQERADFFRLELRYHNDELLSAVLDGTPLARELW
ncbi:MAG: 8-oxo-dGTP diphosphatase [Oscillospiraceae bacterium]|jgi:8-oxo-dGTP pyrophosphatase MutT (NUDIX family)|nr:8-oxo-dGTP diphosphatase [Oscillospiraceae bacterium]